MIKELTEFQKSFNSHQIKLLMRSRDKIIKDFTCYLITEISQATDLTNLVDESEVITIDKIGEQHDQYFVIFVDKAIIFFKECEINLFSNLFIKKERRNCIITASKRIIKELLSCSNLNVVNEAASQLIHEIIFTCSN